MKKNILIFFLILKFAYSNEYTARALISSLDKTNLSSQIAGNIIYLNKNEGDSFKKGEVLVKIDCEVYQAKLDEARVQTEIAKLKYEKNKQLDSYKTIGKFEVSLSLQEYLYQKKLEKIAAINVKRCTVKAPFDGRIVQKKVNKFQNINPNDEIFEIVGISNLEAKIIVPSDWLLWLKKNQKLQILVDETQEKVDAKIKQIGAVVDSASKTVLLRATFIGAYENIIPGMSATAQFKKD